MAKILIAEHNQSIQTSLKQKLSGKGHELRFESQDNHTWAAVGQDMFDVMIIDLLMPALDGFTLAQKALYANPSVQIIFVTGFAAVTMDTHNTPAYAPDPVTSRPFHITKIAERIDYLTGHTTLPIHALCDLYNAENNVIYADFGS